MNHEIKYSMLNGPFRPEVKLRLTIRKNPRTNQLDLLATHSPEYCILFRMFGFCLFFVLEITALQASHVTNKHTSMGVCILQLGCQRRPGVDIAMQFTPGAVPPSAYPAASCVLFGAVRLPGSSVQRWPPFSVFILLSPPDPLHFSWPV